MPRRREISKREILPDPKYSNSDVAKFVNVLMSQGKKSVAERIVYGAFESIAKKGGKDPLEVFRSEVFEQRCREVRQRTHEPGQEVGCRAHRLRCVRVHRQEGRQGSAGSLQIGSIRTAMSRSSSTYS